MKSKEAESIQQDIAEMEVNLERALEDVGNSRGPVQDSLKLMVPMIQDQLKLLRRVLVLVELNLSEMKSATDPRLFDQS